MDNVYNDNIVQQNETRDSPIAKNDVVSVKCKNEAFNHGLIESIHEEFRKEKKIMDMEICTYVKTETFYILNYFFRTGTEVTKDMTKMCEVHFEQSTEFRQDISVEVVQQSRSLLLFVAIAIIIFFCISLYFKYRKKCSCCKKRNKKIR